MKILLKAALAATVATGLLATPAVAANSDTKPFTATARIIKPLTLTNTVDLDFGTITMGAALTSSTVVVGRSGGAAVSSCGTNLLCTAPTAAVFTVSGVALQGLDVTFSNPGTLDDGAGNSVPFTVDAPTTIALDGTGVTTFEIGGSITVASTTADGTYTNDVNVTVEYN